MWIETDHGCLYNTDALSKIYFGDDHIKAELADLSTVTLVADDRRNMMDEMEQLLKTSIQRGSTFVSFLKATYDWEHRKRYGDC